MAALPNERKGNRATSQDDVNTLCAAPSVGPVPFHPHRPVALGSTLGKYTIYAILGQGGMGNVYAAKDPLIKRDVAIKLLPPELVRDPGTLARFLVEAQAAGRLNHPNVVTIYEVVQVNDGAYAIVMELVRGGSVQDYLSKKGSPGWRAATRIIGEAAKALAAAHELGLIHRDIKPANLLLTADSHVKVADFGLAKIEAADSQLNTQAGTIIGTPAFMSPEQCRGDRIDARTDIYSLGCTYFAMLTRKPPFEAGSSMQVMFAHCSSPIPDPRDIAADVPPACADILAKALAKDPNDRYASARDMLNDLRAVLNGATITSASASPLAALSEAVATLPDEAATHTSQRFVRPKPSQTRIWLSVAAASVVIIAAGVAIIWGMISASRPRPVSSVPAIAGGADSEARPPSIVAIAPAAPALPPVNAPANRPAALPKSPIVGVSAPAVPDVLQKTTPLPVPKAPTAVASNNLPDTAAPSAPVPLAPAPSVDVTLHKDAPPLEPSITNDFNMKLVLVQAGKFTMGDDRIPDAPRHEVTITKPFYLGAFEVTQGQFRVVMGEQVAAKAHHDDLPAIFISWEEANDFCRRLNASPVERKAGRFYRLPTEAEWEYACRAGTSTRYAFGDVLHPEQANFGKSAPAGPPPDDRPPMANGATGQNPGDNRPGPAAGPNAGRGEQPNRLPADAPNGGPNGGPNGFGPGPNGPPDGPGRNGFGPGPNQAGGNGPGPNGGPPGGGPPNGGPPGGGPPNGGPPGGGPNDGPPPMGPGPRNRDPNANPRFPQNKNTADPSASAKKNGTSKKQNRPVLNKGNGALDAAQNTGPGGAPPSEPVLHPPGQNKPNAWGLYDMHGNAWEWCADFYGALTPDAQTDPAGPPTGSAHVSRGGSWASTAEQCASAYRNGPAQSGQSEMENGFRVVCEPRPPQ